MTLHAEPSPWPKTSLKDKAIGPGAEGFLSGRALPNVLKVVVSPLDVGGSSVYVLLSLVNKEIALAF